MGWYNKHINNKDISSKSIWEFDVKAKVSIPKEESEDAEIEKAYYVVKTVMDKAKDSAYLETAIDSNIYININANPSRVN